MEFKRVPAIDKCFQILELFEKKREALGITEISNKLTLHKSTVFNIVYTLSDLGILENIENKFRFGTRLYVLGKSAELGSDLIRNIHPYLKDISKKTNLSAFLGIRSGLKAVIIDKSDSSYDLKISAEIGARIPLIAGAHGKAFLSLLTIKEINDILSDQKSKKYIRRSGKNIKEYLDCILKVKEEGFVYEDEEYLEGVRAMAIPLNLNRGDLQCAIWAVGLKNQINETSLKTHTNFLRKIADKIENKISSSGLGQ